MPPNALGMCWTPQNQPEVVSRKVFGAVALLCIHDIRLYFCLNYIDMVTFWNLHGRDLSFQIQQEIKGVQEVPINYL